MVSKKSWKADAVYGLLFVLFFCFVFRCFFVLFRFCFFLCFTQIFNNFHGFWDVLPVIFPNVLHYLCLDVSLYVPQVFPFFFSSCSLFKCVCFCFNCFLCCILMSCHHFHSLSCLLSLYFSYLLSFITPFLSLVFFLINFMSPHRSRPLMCSFSSTDGSLSFFTIFHVQMCLFLCNRCLVSISFNFL